MRLAPVQAARATLVGLAAHYLCFYAAGSPLWTDTIAQWIMARTPSAYALWMLGNLGPWAKPLAMTGGLAVLGFGVAVMAMSPRRWLVPLVGAAVAVMYGYCFHYTSWLGQISFWFPAAAASVLIENPIKRSPGNAGISRRDALVMAGGTLAVALESYARERRFDRLGAAPVSLAPFDAPADVFAPGLVRKPVTPVGEFYGMSKNTVDPSPDPRTWRLRISVDGKLARTLAYSDLLALPRVSGYSTMRCVSNTLKSDLMGTALWTGVRLEQLIERASLPRDIVEAAFLGVDGHGDSLSLDYAFSDAALLAVGMNGKTLNRTHGFPLRLIAPRYYGFKNVKWLGEIAFVREPFFGTWPKLGYTKEPAVHTGTYIDRIVHSGTELRLGGVAYAGDRGIRKVEVRGGRGEWLDAVLEAPLSPLCWRRWTASLPAPGVLEVQARAMDGLGNWQSGIETPLFPDGVQGPTTRRVS